jgi:hypothetical protein
MNRTQKAIIANWGILTGGALCVFFRLNHLFPYVVLLFLFVRVRFVDDEATLRAYFSNRNRMTIALLACSITPWVWFIYRLLSTPSLPDTIGRELLAFSIPLLLVMAVFDRWLYLRSMRIATSR